MTNNWDRGFGLHLLQVLDGGMHTVLSFDDFTHINDRFECGASTCGQG